MAQAAADPAEAPARDAAWLDSIIHRLLAAAGRPGALVDLPLWEIVALCQRARAVFMDQPVLLELAVPVKLCGDIHGQYHDLLRIFETAGFPPDENYLFLGDYVDRGRQSLETICLLFAFKVRYPQNFFVLRGNHEEASINRIYGFYDECRRRYNVKLWKTFCDTFNCMPVAGLVESRVLCMHGGIPNTELLPHFEFDDIRRLRRPITRVGVLPGQDPSTLTPADLLVQDLLWADPAVLRRDRPADDPEQPQMRGFAHNRARGISHTFGSDVLSAFMDKHNLDLIARAHEVVEDGYRFAGNPERPKGCITIFSAPNYTFVIAPAVGAPLLTRSRSLDA